MRDWSYPRALAVALAAAIGLTLLVGGATSTAAFGAFNPSWDGTAEFRSLAAETGGESDVLRESGAYGDLQANGTLAVVLSPAEPYQNAGPLRDFVRRGGTLLVAEDHGRYGNDLLSAVGATARIDGRALRDERAYGQSPAFPVITNVSDHSLSAGAEQLAFNHGTAVEPGNATVLATSGEFAYLDANGDGGLDDAEELGPRPVATVESVGEGHVVAVGDPSVFINAMIDVRDNRAFARAVVGAHDRVRLDTSHAGGVPAVVAAQLAVQETPWLQLAGGSLLVLVLAGVPRLRSVARRRLRDRRRSNEVLADVDREAVTDVLAERYPDWDEARVAHVTDTIMSRQTEVADNDAPE